MTDADGKQGGSPATAEDILVKTSSKGGSGRWTKAVNSVRTLNIASGKFTTLRDMFGDLELQWQHLRPVKKLGEGGFGVVQWMVYEPPGAVAKDLAVKRLHANGHLEDRAFKDFIAEVQLLRKLAHRNIVSFCGIGTVEEEPSRHGSGLERTETAQEKLQRAMSGAGDVKEAGEVFLAQEFCAGGALRDVLGEQMSTLNGVLYKWDTGLRWILDIARGLQYLHNANPQVIHRDMKMENVLLTNHHYSDPSCRAKIADFGLSRLVEQRNERVRADLSKFEEQERKKPTDLASYRRSMTMRQAQIVPGTKSTKDVYVPQDLTGGTGSLMYMAPEVQRGEKYNEKADVFSFAMIMYEILTIQLQVIMVPGGTPEDIERHATLVAEGYRPKIPEKWPAPVAALVQQCWADNPADRPSMSTVVEKLEGILQSDLAAKYVVEHQKRKLVQSKKAKAAGVPAAAEGGGGGSGGGCCAVM
ncbi:unnamed protein product [Pedinophyceae sp. YPF-701]|nr:unnamed protein product [Pedinophyceae sp. YPF-701]